jgi:hypothetical protein
MATQWQWHVKSPDRGTGPSAAPFNRPPSRHGGDAMIDAAYYRRQAATCRIVAREFRDALPLLDLADYFERLAAQVDVPDRASNGNRKPVPGGFAEAYGLDLAS